MPAKKISYSRGFPYGAPLAIIRGGATRDEQVKSYLRERGFRWDGTRYAWTHYLDRSDFGPILKTLRDVFGCEVVAKADMDKNYIIDLDNDYRRPE
jgi:hypothetical protein